MVRTFVPGAVTCGYRMRVLVGVAGEQEVVATFPSLWGLPEIEHLVYFLLLQKGGVQKGGVLRGRVDGHGRELRVSVEAPWLGGVDVTGKGGSLFSFCARLGALLPWAGRVGLPLGDCSCGVSMARAEG